MGNPKKKVTGRCVEPNLGKCSKWMDGWMDGMDRTDRLSNYSYLTIS